METHILYFDEAGDDGLKTGSSEYFILTSMSIPASSWRESHEIIKTAKRQLKSSCGFPVKMEMHTKAFLTNKKPYQNYEWSKEQRLNILNAYLKIIDTIDVRFTNVVIDKTHVDKSLGYAVLENALKYSLQREENTSAGNWNFIVIADEGRIGPMRKTARSICAYNPIPSQISAGTRNLPLQYLVEDILQKGSHESYHIQLCDMVSYFVHLYYKCCVNNQRIPGRVANLVDLEQIKATMEFLKNHDKLNLRAAPRNEYGLVVYPR